MSTPTLRIVCALLGLALLAATCSSSSVTENWLYHNVLNGSYSVQDRPVTGLPGTPTQVHVSIEIVGVPRVDTATGVVNVIATFRTWWEDPRLQYNATLASVPEGGHITVRKSDIWAPSDVDVSNQLSRKPQSPSRVNQCTVKPSGDCYCSEVYDMRLMCPFDVAMFPYGAHIGVCGCALTGRICR